MKIRIELACDGQAASKRRETDLILLLHKLGVKASVSAVWSPLQPDGIQHGVAVVIDTAVQAMVPAKIVFEPSEVGDNTAVEIRQATATPKPFPPPRTGRLCLCGHDSIRHSGGGCADCTACHGFAPAAVLEPVCWLPAARVLGQFVYPDGSSIHGTAEFPGKTRRWFAYWAPHKKTGTDGRKYRAGPSALAGCTAEGEDVPTYMFHSPGEAAWALLRGGDGPGACPPPYGAEIVPADQEHLSVKEDA